MEATVRAVCRSCRPTEVGIQQQTGVRDAARGQDRGVLPLRGSCCPKRISSDVKWWTDKLLPIMERIARNAAGADDPELWQRIYKVEGGSGGPFIGGWIRRFFPYVQYPDSSKGKGPDGKPGTRLVPNEWLDQDDEPKQFNGMTTGCFPPSLSKVPLTWLYHAVRSSVCPASCSTWAYPTPCWTPPDCPSVPGWVVAVPLAPAVPPLLNAAKAD